MWSVDLSAQSLTQRGFVEGSGVAFPQRASNDDTRLVGDLLVREEAFLKPRPWVQFAAGLDLRADSHDQTDDGWRIDLSDRGVRRPRLSVRRLSATLTHGPFTVSVGKQFVRWGKTDIVTPTDRFAPRDFLNVVDTEFLPIAALRGAAQIGGDTIEVVWAPRLTPSRVPLLGQRWSPVPPEAAAIPVVDAGASLPERSEVGVRWAHVGQGLEYSLSYFNGFNHLPLIQASLRPNVPEIDIARVYPSARMYGADVALPTRWLTIKAETAYVTSPASAAATEPRADDYVLYVVQIERQSGEWVFVGGYAGEVVTQSRSALTFAPDRGLSRAVVARASYTLDTNRSLAVESAVHQDGRGFYAKAEYSQARGQHWRATAAFVAIAGHSDDFLGEYHRNSHAVVTLRYSF